MTTRPLPAHLAAARMAGEPIRYLWDSRVSDQIRWADDEGHPGLAQALALDARAALGVAAAAGAWVSWRMHGLIEVDEALQRVEAAWVAMLDPQAVRMLRPGEPFPKDNTKAHGPLKLARILLTQAVDAARAGEASQVRAVAMSMVLLARQVVPDPAVFEFWLSEVLRRARQRYPEGSTAAIAPVFFEPGFQGDEASLRAHRDDWLRGVSAADNPFLDAQALAALQAAP